MPGVGLDCVGLLIHVARRLEIPYEDSQGYGRVAKNGLLEATLQLSLGSILVEDARLGDVLVFRVWRHPQHVAIVTDHGVIHTLADHGRVVEHVLGEPWRSRICSAYRYPRPA